MRFERFSGGDVRQTPASRAQTALACAAACVFGALAGGVLWCFASVSLPFGGEALIIPIGFALGAFLRWQGFHGRTAMIGAALSTVLAFGYAQYLFGAVRIAQMLGLPLREALFKAGFGLTADVAWANLHWLDWSMLAMAVIASASVGALRRQRAIELSAH